MSDNILIDVSTTIENVNVEVVEASAASIGIEYFYPQGPIGPTGPQGPAGTSNFNNYIYTTVSQNVSSNRKYGFDTTLGSLTATLPSNPQLGDEIEFFDIGGKWLLNPLTINNNTKFIEQLNDKLLCNVKFGIFKLIYAGLITGWRIVPLPKHDVPSFVAPVVSISSTIDIGYNPITIGFIGINNLSPTIGPVDNWYWNLTGGNTTQFTTSAVTYTYSTPGVYTVTLTGSNVVGIGTATRTITAASSDPYSDYVTLLLHFNN